MNKSAILAAACALPLSACATTSFAPPSVPVQLAGGGMLTGGCGGRRAAGTTPLAVERNVSGALRYVEAHLQAYDCSAREAADGRQGFEVPSFLVTAGAMTAAAFGAGTDIAIAGTAANSVLSGGKAYYDPKLKSAIYGHAVDALGCIRTEALGMSSFAAIKSDSDKVNAAGFKGLMLGDGTPASTVTVSTDEQYFGMVTDAADRVRGILTTRLSNVGSFDPAGLAAEFAQNAQRIRDEEEKKKTETPAGVTGTKSLFSLGTDPSADAIASRQKLVQLDLDVLRPKLQQCIWRAKV